MLEHLEILYEDEHLVAINKPHGLLVHRTSLAKDASTSVLKILRNQLGRYVYPVHRLDRKTSGVLLMALDKPTQSYLNKQFEERKVEKVYHAIVRGFTDSNGEIDYAIKNDRDQIKEALTKFKTLAQFEIDIPLGKHETSRYSLVELYPLTGRYHQLRMHMAHIFHPIIGDRPHGCNKQNRMFKEKFGMIKMLLHAKSIAIETVEGRNIKMEAPYSRTFEEMLKLLD